MADKQYFRNGKSFRYQADGDSLVGRGAYGRVFAGYFKSNLNTSSEVGVGEKAAIKRVEISFEAGKCMDIENDREVIALKELSHPFIVTLYAVEDDDNFRNFVFELCQANLEDFITKKYKEVMPDEIEGLYQMASGLKFIHEKKMIHRDIKPENILISSDGLRAYLKISDFGFTKPLKEDGIHYDLASGLKGTEYYMAPELLRLKNINGRILDVECTTASDVFAAGCTFFRYLTGGVHPFGNGFNIERNITDGKPINLGNDGEQWKTDLIANMIKFDPIERVYLSEIVYLLENHLETPGIQALQATLIGGEFISPVIVGQNSVRNRMINVGDIQINRSKVLGKGAYGVVFAGKFKGKEVAIKRVELWDSDASNRELINNQRLINHPNIVQFIHLVEDDDFRYFVLELCAASLYDYIKGEYNGPMPTDEQVLFQLASGLEYIHSRGILHRDVTPNTIQISLTKPVQMKCGDFGLRGTYSLSGVKGTLNWISPEELEVMERFERFERCQRFGRFEIIEIIERTEQESIKSDIFSAGCIFVFFLLRGKHPFGNDGEKDYKIMLNIKYGKPVNLKELPEKHFARRFVIQMIERNPEKRISLQEVIDYLKPLQPPSRLSLLQYDNQNRLNSEGTHSLVYDVGTFEGSLLAIKRVPLEYFTTNKFEELKNLQHSNVVRLLHFDQDDHYQYFGMEMCAASLDKLFFPEEDSKKYKGPIPSDEQFCFQLISGLQYIHEQGLVHGSIKPTNVLISLNNSDDSQIKLSDVGLTTSRHDGHTTQRLITGFLSSRYWLAPELIDSNNGQNKPTKESDIFAAGSVFYYFLSKGRHLFGNLIHKIIENISEGIYDNVFLNQMSQIGYFSIIRWMTTKNPEERSTLLEVTEQMKFFPSLSAILSTEKLKKIGDIQFSREPSHIIGTGGQASVFLGFSKGSIVAVKRIQIDVVESKNKSKVYRERDSFKQLDHHNIIKLFDYAESKTFMVLALEKCLTSLEHYCRKPKVCRIIPMPTEREVLLQMAQGLEYIHLKELIHRDVKPLNILISGDNPAVIKWADFGMSRAVITGSKTFSWSKLQGTDRWLAPELVEAPTEDRIEGSQKCDIFALGCVFFFFLVSGIHPFGDNSQHSTQNNIKNNNPVNFSRLPKKHFAFDIIEGMIMNDRESRSKLPDVVQKLLNCNSTIAHNNEKFLTPTEVSNDLVMLSPAKRPRKENK